MKLSGLTILFLFFLHGAYAQMDTAHYIRVNFLYGSKPHPKHKDTEQKYFGGLHGGHVTIQAGDVDYGFRRTNKGTHLFPKKKRTSTFSVKKLNGQSRYGEGRKTVTFIIPVTKNQYDSLQNIYNDYCATSPYDYAFFGMRCAASTREILGMIGVMKKKSRFHHIATAFYPQRLRKRLFKIAKANNYEMIQTEGRPTRIWEKD